MEDYQKILNSPDALELKVATDPKSHTAVIRILAHGYGVDLIIPQNGPMFSSSYQPDKN